MLIKPIPLFIFAWIHLYPWPTNWNHPRHEWIVWNVGQGQWLTHVNSTTQVCFHFDFGGERSPFFQVQTVCDQYQNKLLLSHPDWDHYSFFREIRSLKNVCLFDESLKYLRLSKKRNHRRLFTNLKPLPKCQQQIENALIQTSSFKKDSNSSSNILHYRGVLATGDATVGREKEWLNQLSAQDRQNIKNKTTILILGHHGSKTSTSLEILNALPNIKQAIASARFLRYGHPHIQTLARLRLKKIPLLRTEDWGNIRFQLKDEYWQDSSENETRTK